MNFNLKTKSAIYVMLNILSFAMLFVFGTALVGREFFVYLGRGFHYIYFFIFKRAFDYKTIVVIAVTLLVLASLCYCVYRLAKKDNIKLHELLAPVTTLVAPLMVFAAYRGKALGIWDSSDSLLVILTLVFLCIYVLTSLIFLFDSFRTSHRERVHARQTTKKHDTTKVVEVKITKEVVVKEEKKVEPAPVVVAAKPEPVVAAVVEEEPVVVANKKKVVRRPFAEKMTKASDEIKDNYNVLKNELLSYGVKSRISHGGDTFRLRKREYAKITLVGKNLKLYVATDPAKYEGTTIPFRDESAKKCFAATPTMIKIKSPLSVKRAKMMIADVMAEADLPQGEVANTNYVRQLKTKKARVAKK